MNSANLQPEGLMLAVAALFGEMKRKGSLDLTEIEAARRSRTGRLAADDRSSRRERRSDPVSDPVSEGRAPPGRSATGLPELGR